MAAPKYVRHYAVNVKDQSRRRFLIGGLASTIGISQALYPASGIARDPSPPLDVDGAVSPLVRRVTRSPDNTYFTYPHSNGFLPDSRYVVASPTGPGILEYIAVDLQTGHAELLARLEDARTYYSIAQNGTMLTANRKGAAVVNLMEKNAAPHHLLDDDSAIVSADVDISANGRFALLTRLHQSATPQASTLDIVDVKTGQIQSTYAPGWRLDHGHFSPADPNWIFVCKNEGGQREPQRMWGWNAEKAPEGRNLFDQEKDPTHVFYCGHERAMFHKPGVLFVVYSSSSAAPRGLYQVDFRGGPAKLVSEGNRDLHCNISRSGRWAVVSLQGLYSSQNLRADSHWSDTGQAYAPTDVMLVNMRNGQRHFLFRGTTDSKGKQPYEAQPSISPDDRWVLLKDARQQCILALELEQQVLQRILA